MAEGRYRLTYSDREFVTRQYRDASKLNARIALHERFSTNPYGLQGWIFDHFELPDDAEANRHRRVADLEERLGHELDPRGTINITRDAGLFVARK